MRRRALSRCLSEGAPQCWWGDRLGGALVSPDAPLRCWPWTGRASEPAREQIKPQAAWVGPAGRGQRGADPVRGCSGPRWRSERAALPTGSGRRDVELAKTAKADISKSAREEGVWASGGPAQGEAESRASDRIPRAPRRPDTRPGAPSGPAVPGCLSR